MTCSACGTENMSGRKFCLECGAPLAMTCAACAAANPPKAKFCGDCGAPIRVEPASGKARADRSSAIEPAVVVSAPVSERRVVSVLFADLVGFTTLSESRDVEDVRDLLTRYFDICRTLVARYGGVIEKFIGDAVMAVWGAPIAKEDDAERAVRAALDLIPAVGALGDEVGAPGLMARAGVLTGEAADRLVGEIQGLPEGHISPSLQAHGLRLRAKLAADSGSGDAEGGFQGAARLFCSIGVPFGLGVTLLEHGEILVEEGRLDEAAPLLNDAREVFERLRAQPWLDRLTVATSAVSATTAR